MLLETKITNILTSVKQNLISISAGQQQIMAVIELDKNTDTINNTDFRDNPNMESQQDWLGK